jgi:DNA polymerase III subunit epsilon
MYSPDFLDGFDRLVAFDAETTGTRTPDATFRRLEAAGADPEPITKLSRSWK